MFLLKYKLTAKGQDTKFDITKTSAQGWQNLRYLMAMSEIRKILGADSREYEEFVGRLRSLFCHFCPCIPNHSTGRWFGRSKVKDGNDTFTCLCFNEDGKRIETKGRRIGSWLREPRVDRDWRWSLLTKEALNVTAMEAQRRLYEVDGVRCYA